MGLLSLPVVGKAIDKVLDIVDKFVPDKELARKLKQEVLIAEYDAAEKEMDARAKIIIAEAKSEHWLTSTWRPIIMLLFGLIIFNNWVLYPYVSLFWANAPKLEIPPDMWGLLKLGFGGYIIGRSGERIVKVWKGTK